MGRFFKIEKPEYVDGIFQPNIELEKQLIEQQLKTDFLKKSLLFDRPELEFKFDQVDAQRAADLKSNLDSEVGGLVQDILNNPDNVHHYQDKLKQLKNKISTSLASGDLHKIQKNAENIDNYKKQLSLVQDAETSKAYQKLLDDYIQNNPDGAYGQIFEKQNLLQRADLVNNFLNSNNFNKLQADKMSDIYEFVNGEWKIKQGVSKEELSKDKLMNAFRQYFIDNGGVEYANTFDTKLEIENWLDENGEIDWNTRGSKGHELLQLIGNHYSKKNIEKSTTLGENQFALANQRNLQNAMSQLNQNSQSSGKVHYLSTQVNFRMTRFRNINDIFNSKIKKIVDTVNVDTELDLPYNKRRESYEELRKSGEEDILKIKEKTFNDKDKIIYDKLVDKYKNDKDYQKLTEDGEKKYFLLDKLNRLTGDETLKLYENTTELKNLKDNIEANIILDTAVKSINQLEDMFINNVTASFQKLAQDNEKIKYKDRSGVEREMTYKSLFETAIKATENLSPTYFNDKNVLLNIKNSKGKGRAYVGPPQDLNNMTMEQILNEPGPKDVYRNSKVLKLEKDKHIFPIILTNLYSDMYWLVPYTIHYETDDGRKMTYQCEVIAPAHTLSISDDIVVENKKYGDIKSYSDLVDFEDLDLIPKEE